MARVADQRRQPLGLFSEADEDESRVVLDLHIRVSDPDTIEELSAHAAG